MKLGLRGLLALSRGVDGSGIFVMVWELRWGGGGDGLDEDVRGCQDG